jgi:hypothetical protein
MDWVSSQIPILSINILAMHTVILAEAWAGACNEAQLWLSRCLQNPRLCYLTPHVSTLSSTVNVEGIATRALTKHTAHLKMPIYRVLQRTHNQGNLSMAADGCRKEASTKYSTQSHKGINAVAQRNQRTKESTQSHKEINAQRNQRSRTKKSMQSHKEINADAQRNQRSTHLQFVNIRLKSAKKMSRFK